VAGLPPAAVLVAAAYAVAFLVEHALEVARCPPWVRGAGVLLFAVVLVIDPVAPARAHEALAALSFTAATAGTVAWYRRGDRRALSTAGILFAGAWVVAPGGWVLTAAGALWLLIGTPAPSRARAAAWCAVPALLAFALRERAADVHAAANVGAWTPALSPLVVVMFVLVVAARWIDLRRVRERAWNPSGAPVGHEEAMLLRTIITLMLITLAASTFAPRLPLVDPMGPSLFVLALLSGLALKRFARRNPAGAAA